MPVKKLTTILFDLDGTLIDTEPAAATAVVETFREWGVTVQPGDSAYVTGRTWDMALKFLFKKYPVNVPFEPAKEQMLAAYRQALHRELTRIPYGVEAVKALSPHFSLALVSGSYRSEILWALDEMGIRDQFKVVLGAEDYPQSKPAPDGYNKALQLLGEAPERALVFEDSEAGIASGREAGCWVVAVTVANHFGHDISKAHHSIRDFNGVGADWVRALNLKASS